MTEQEFYQKIRDNCFTIQERKEISFGDVDFDFEEVDEVSGYYDGNYTEMQTIFRVGKNPQLYSLDWLCDDDGQHEYENNPYPCEKVEEFVKVTKYIKKQ